MFQLLNPALAFLCGTHKEIRMEICMEICEVVKFHHSGVEFVTLTCEH